MMEIFIYVIVGLLIAIVFLLVWQLRRGSSVFLPLEGKLDVLKNLQERTESSVRDEIVKFRAEAQTQSREQRGELSISLKGFGDSVEQKMEAVRLVVDAKLKNIQEDNARQLEEMRKTVDEKLHTTLENRLGEAFKMVNAQLEQVHQGLGDMRNLAAGVGDLKKVLTNIKARGTWGEVQLGALLEEILAPEQYAKNVKINENSGDFVEFAIKLPGQGDVAGEPVWMPVDAKFPVEDYQRLLDAQENGDLLAAEEAAKQLETSIKKAGKDISQKYLSPPRTTDFGIMFLPSEGLYAEVIRRTALVQVLQRQYHIVVSGPSTFAAFLNSLQMGFRTLAIQKRSGEVWKVLSEVKAAFGRFGDSLDVVRKRLEQAATSVDDAQKKTRTLSSKLRSVEATPDLKSEILLEDETLPELEES
ncbi:MAG: DNA recombination protein RmuC [Syntrophaceae bacterium]|nr:DNA recombination protein RmuC [Syntrophaceae bacterium]